MINAPINAMQRRPAGSTAQEQINLQRAAQAQQDASKSKRTIITGPGRVKSFGKITMGEDGWLVFEGFSIDCEGADDPRLAICNAALKEIAKQKYWMLQKSQGCAVIAALAKHDELSKLTKSSSEQDADKVDAALAEMVHAMFRSGNSVPVTRITIDRKQYDAAIDAARKEQA